MEENRNEMNMEATANEYVESEVVEDENSGSLLGTLVVLAAGAAIGYASVEGGKKLFGWGKKKVQSFKTKQEAKKFVDAQKVQAEVVEPEEKETK